MKVLVLFLWFGFCFAQSFDTPLQETLSDPRQITMLMQEAKENVLLATPIVSATLEQELMNAAARGVAVYFITPSTNPNITLLVGAGVRVKTLESFSEGMVLADKSLVVGGMLSGTDTPTLKIDTQNYGVSVLSQFLAVWQVAKEPG